VEPEVVVVGGGAIGVSVAYDLALRGVRTTLVERGTLGGGCSWGNAGLICPSHSAPLATPAALAEGLRGLLRRDGVFSIAPRPGTAGWLLRYAAACRAERAGRGMHAIRTLSVASLELHAELAALGTGFERRGILSVFETEARLRSHLPSGTAQFFRPDEARALEPALRGPIAGAVYFPDEAHVDPLRYVGAIGEAAAKAGADVNTNVEVRSLAPLETSAGRLRPKTIVLAAGVWAAALARPLGVRIPLTGGKGYHLDFEPAAGDPRVPMLLQEARSAVTPLPDRLRIAGTLTVAGLDAGVDERRVAAMRSAAARVLGRDGGSVLDVWAGLRPCTPDGLPVIGRPAAAPGLILATGHAMKGVSLAPVTGRLVADLATGEPPTLDVAPFSPDRFR
jgi:D-amino-acid dehydrogenase